MSICGKNRQLLVATKRYKKDENTLLGRKESHHVLNHPNNKNIDLKSGVQRPHEKRGDTEKPKE
jgi:ribosomal protein S24E